MTLPARADLGDGLVLRSARVGDRAELAEFNAAMHADVDLPGESLAEWTHDLFEQHYPWFQPERDVAVVEDTATGRIVSAVFLLPQVWSYAGVPVQVGQPELIATDPAYRRRGLVRALLDAVHEWSQEAGHLWQLISGIPWYYRQFGYTYALDLPPPPTLWLGPNAPAAPGQHVVRRAGPADVAFLAEVEAGPSRATALGPWRGADGFTLELGRRPASLVASEVLVVESRSAARPVGFVAHAPRLRNGLVTLRAFELVDGQSWLGPTADVVAHLHTWLAAHPEGPGRGIRFALPPGHPALRCAATRLSCGTYGTYGLYLRVPDIVALLRAVHTVLEDRLGASPAVGWTGELRLDLYTGGLRLAFRDGRLDTIEPWTPPEGDERAAAARLTRDDLLQLVFGNRRLDDLERSSPDCLLETDTGALLLDVLFPPMLASTWELC